MIQVEITWNYKVIGIINYSRHLFLNEKMQFKYDGIEYSFQFHLNSCTILIDTIMLSDINKDGNWVNITLIK